MNTQFKGTITSIEFESLKNHYDKYKVGLQMDFRQSCFIEFRSKKMMREIANFKPGDKVVINARHEANVSKHSGLKYNNIIAKDINIIDQE